jgi:chromosomal replication initiation ATPase DnaA
MRSESVEAERRTVPEGTSGGRVIPFDRVRRSGAAAAVVAIVARRRGVPLGRMLHRSRCEADVAEARMLAMYLVHVVLGRTYSEVGAVFGRDRTTVAHACARIEDLRDLPSFDEEVASLEEEIEAAQPEEVRHAAG